MLHIQLQNIKVLEDVSQHSHFIMIVNECKQEAFLKKSRCLLNGLRSHYNRSLHRSLLCNIIIAFDFRLSERPLAMTAKNYSSYYCTGHLWVLSHFMMNSVLREQVTSIHNIDCPYSRYLL